MILCLFFSFVSRKEVRQAFKRRERPCVFLLYHTLNLSYIFIQQNPIFLYNFCQKWLDPVSSVCKIMITTEDMLSECKKLF
jgi:hypothetical protein